MAISAPGDTVLAPNPSYPMYAFGFVIAGANVRSVPIGPGFDFFAGLDRAYRHRVPAPTALIVRRSEGRRVGKAGVSTCMFRWADEQSKKNKNVLTHTYTTHICE